MRTTLLLLFAFSATSAAQASDRFTPGNPTFGEFAATCRSGDAFVLECQGGVFGAYAAAMSTNPDRVSCDGPAFWKEADKLAGHVIDVLPWQSVVEQIVLAPGVCHPKPDTGL